MLPSRSIKSVIEQVKAKSKESCSSQGIDCQFGNIREAYEFECVDFEQAPVADDVEGANGYKNRHDKSY